MQMIQFNLLKIKRAMNLRNEKIILYSILYYNIYLCMVYTYIPLYIEYRIMHYIYILFKYIK